MKTRTTALFLGSIVLFSSPALGQASFTVAQLEGKAKVQRPPKRTWASVAVDNQLLDNDLVETFFKARIVLKFGSASAVILGSNSKALLNIKEESISGAKRYTLNMTLFAGGLLVNNAGEGRVEVYTANGVVEVDSGTVSGVVEAKTGHTGFQVLGGTARVRNVAQKQGKLMQSGQTTVILPGREPTAALHMTFKHVSVLKHFFGSEYIEHEMQVSGIQPTADDAGTNRLSLSRNLAAQQQPGTADMGIYKALFSLEKIYGSILADEERQRRKYRTAERIEETDETRLEVGLGGGLALAGGGAYPTVMLTTAYDAPMYGVGVRVPLAKDVQGMSPHFSGLQGILDKVDYVRFGSHEQERYLRLGGIEGLTFGSGLMVNNFSNQNAYSVVRPMGFLGRFNLAYMSLKGFLNDVTNPGIGGANLSLDPGGIFFALGYTFDRQRFERQVTNEYARFVEFPERALVKVPNPSSTKANIHVCEVELTSDVIDRRDLGVTASAQFAQRFNYRKFRRATFPAFIHDTIDTLPRPPDFTAADSVRLSAFDRTTPLDGCCLRAPYVNVEFLNMKISAGYIFEFGRLTTGQFNSLYSTNRLREMNADSTTYLFLRNNVLSTSRKVNSAELKYGISIIKGTSLDLYFKHDFGTKKVFADTNFSANSPVKDNFTFGISFTMNESAVPKIPYAHAYFRQSDGGYYPANGTYLASWGLEGGFEIETAPLFAGFAIEAGFKFYNLDLDAGLTTPERFNNQIDPDDKVIDIRLGVRRRFL